MSGSFLISDYICLRGMTKWCYRWCRLSHAAVLWLRLKRVESFVCWMETWMECSRSWWDFRFKSRKAWWLETLSFTSTVQLNIHSVMNEVFDLWIHVLWVWQVPEEKIVMKWRFNSWPCGKRNVHTLSGHTGICKFCNQIHFSVCLYLHCCCSNDVSAGCWKPLSY